jgi:hypothetical protein
VKKIHHEQRNGVYFAPYIANVTSDFVIKHPSQLLRLYSINDRKIIREHCWNDTERGDKKL